MSASSGRSSTSLARPVPPSSASSTSCPAPSRTRRSVSRESSSSSIRRIRNAATVRTSYPPDLSFATAAATAPTAALAARSLRFTFAASGLVDDPRCGLFLAALVAAGPLDRAAHLLVLTLPLRLLHSAWWHGDGLLDVRIADKGAAG